MTCSLYTVMESRQSWCKPLHPSQKAKAELHFWSSTLAVYNAQPIWHSLSAVRVIYLDASETGYGGYVVEHGPCVLHGCWTAEEAACSSMRWELSSVCMVLLSVAVKLVNAWVRWFADSQNVAHILQVVSKKPHLHTVALKVFNMSI